MVACIQRHQTSSKRILSVDQAHRELGGHQSSHGDGEVQYSFISEAFHIKQMGGGPFNKLFQFGF